MAIATKNTQGGGETRTAPAGQHPRAKGAVRGNRGIKVVRSVTIRKSPAELYSFWRDLPNLTQVIKHSVTITANGRDESHWCVGLPAGRKVEWDALIINDEPDRLIAWRSRAGADVPNAGSVRFEPAPGDEGTEVTVALEYNPPGGRLGGFLARLTGDSAGRHVTETLRRLKALMEAGEISTIEGQPAGGPQAPRKGRK